MGVFSTKKSVSVSSVVYNLAGDENDRPDYLKTTLIGGILTPTGETLSETLRRSYLNGPGIKLRAYPRWGRSSGYTSYMGIPSGSLILSQTVDNNALAALIPHDPGQEVLVQTAEIGVPDYTFWVDRYMATFHPSELNTDYISDFDEDTNTISVTLADTSIESFTPTDFDPVGLYLYATYNLVDTNQETPPVTGSEVELDPSDPFPSTSGWVLTGTSNTVPAPGFTRLQEIWERDVYLGGTTGSASTHAVREVMFQWTTTEDATSTVTEKSYRVDTQDIVVKAWSNLQVLIYQQGTGNADLDALFQASESAGDYFPFIPVRLDNTFITPESSHSAFYPSVKKALKKALGSSFDDLRGKVEENPSVGDIDYAYVTFGVSLNVKENACRRYVYEFFQEIMQGQDLTGESLRAWREAYETAEARAIEWQTWFDAQYDPGNPLFGTPEPIGPYYPKQPRHTVRVASSSNPIINYDMAITWSSIEESVGSGLKKPDAKVGELWFEVGEVESPIYDIFTGEGGFISMAGEDIDSILLHWQVTEDSWRTLDIRGLRHRNTIYGGRSVVISGAEALVDPEESGFLIPLHEEIFRRMNLVDATQMSTACCFIVFNCYQIVKEKWYQSGWFKVLLIVAIIVVTVVTGGAGAGSVGLLGANAAVGAALGYTGVAAIIAGAIANAVAAMVLTTIISAGSTAIFGEKVGAIVAVIASVVALQVGASLGSGNLSSSFSQLTRAENILKLTVAAGNGYADYMKAEAQDVMGKTQAVLADYTAQSEAIAAKYDEVLGSGFQILNPLALTDSSQTNIFEPPDSFFSRTLMTGSEVAEMSLSMVTNFAEITLSTELPT